MKQLYTCIALMLLGPSLMAQPDEARLLRFPNIHGDQIVFSHAGDLYTVDRDGGTARQLTSDPGYEMFARFSPDGNWIAFTGQYDGNREVYVMPAEGGTPTRLTYTATLDRDHVWDRMGPNNIVMTWTNDSEHIIFRSRMQSFNSFKGQLFKISREGGMPEQLPFSTAGFCNYSPDGGQMAFNKVFREFRTWKYYQGGMADDIHVFNFDSKEMQKITTNPAQDIMPMWAGEEIYFISDRDRTMNIFKYNTASEEVSKVTDYTNFDVKFPSIGGDAIVYENGGYLYVLDTETDESTKVRVEINDDQASSRTVMKDASEHITGTSLSPKGKRLAMVARGDIWSLPASNGVTRNLTRTSGVHEREVTWSPDGLHLAYISDATGEDEIYVVDPKGSGEPRQITDGGETYKYGLEWSPDGSKILWSDKMLRLRYVDVESQEVTLVKQTEDWEVRNYNWSPDSKWITYTVPYRDQSSQIELYSLESGENHVVTTKWYSSNSANFSRDGKYLLFASARDFNPQYSNTEWNHGYYDMEKVYILPLSKETASPFKLENDEVETEEKTDENGEKEQSEVEVNIDLDGLQDRVEALPIDAGSYGNIHGINGKIYYVMGQMGQKGRKLKVFDLKEEKEATIGDYGNFQISSDGKKMLIKQKDKKYAVVDLPSGETKLEDFVSLEDMEVMVDLNEEWEEVFYESWRQMRDFFYDPGMHGVDWQAMHDKYKPLVKHVNHRADLTYVIGEMIGELNVGHAYTGEGDLPDVKRRKTGLLGAQFEKDASGYFEVTKLLKGENWNDKMRSPLTENGVGVDEGDYIIAINGQPVNEADNIYQLLVDKAGSTIEITYNDEASADGVETTLVKPIANESDLYYYNWVQNNIDKVNEATDGQIGYVHIPDMGPGGLNEFVKHFYPQLSKEGLIIDVRGNGGGNVSPMIIERLRRELTMVDKPRNASKATDPSQMLLGPKVTLLDQWSASDGDLFPYRFKKHNIGPLIGHRSWGGVVGIRGSLPLVDGGYLYKPEFASYDTEGNKWIIEGHGVDPDIEVDNNVYKEYMGEDQQLNKGIEVIMEKLDEERHELPAPPPYPDKSE